MLTTITTQIWQEVELTLTTSRSYEKPYLEVELWADFTHENGTVLRRPGFWDGGNTWKIRFVPTQVGSWMWKTFANVEDAGLGGQSGEVKCRNGSSEYSF